MNEPNRILVVDSNRDILEIYAQLLREMGWEVIEASTGEEGIEQIKRAKPDLVILDKFLSDGDGVEFCRQIKSDDQLRYTYVAIVSAEEIDSDREAKGFTCGVDEYIIRPIPSRKLLSRVKSILRIIEAEKRLRESEELYRLTLSNISDAVLITDDNGEFTFIGPNVDTIFGYSPEEMKRLGNIDEVLEVRLFDWDESEPQREINHLECEIHDKFGEKRFLLVDVKKVNIQHGTLLFTFRDITKRKEFEEELKVYQTELEMQNQELIDSQKQIEFSQEKYIDLYDFAPVGYIVLDQKGVVLEGNIIAANMLSVTQKHLKGKPFIVYLASRSHAPFYNHIQHVMESENPKKCELELISKDGKHVLVLMESVFSRNDKIHTVIIDMNDRKEMERRLEAKDGMLQEILRYSPMLISVMDISGRYELVSQSIVEFLGIKREEIIGKRFEEVLPEETAEIFRQRLKIVLETRAPFIVEDEMDFKNDTPIYSTTLFPLFSENNEIYAIGGIAADISERKRTEQKLQKRTFELNERVKELNCLFQLTSLEEKPNITLMEIYEQAVNIIPNAWQYPENTCARLIIEDDKFQTENFRKTRWKKSDNIVVFGKAIGILEVYYFEEKSDVQIDPFLEEEEKLIGAIAEQLGRITERKRMKERLRENEHIYRAISELVSDYTYVLRLASNGWLIREWISEAFVRITGYTPEEVDEFGGWVELAHIEDREEVIRHRKAFKSGNEDVSEYRIITKDGDIRWLRDYALPFWDDEQDRVYRVIGAAQDITERKKAEQALRESQEKFKMLAEQSPNMIFINKNGRIVYVNKKCEEVMGYSREELYDPDFDFISLVAPEAKNRVYDSFSRHLQGKEVPPYDYMILTKSGKKISAMISTKLVTYEQGNAILGVVTDITERKKMEEALKYRVGMEQILSSISTRFINLPSEKVDDEIQQALKEIGGFSDVDRSYVFLFLESVVDNTHEWCAPGIAPQIDNLKNISMDIFPIWLEKLKKHDPIHIPSVKDLPPEMSTEKEILQSQNIQSLVMVPIVLRNKLIGILGFDSVREEKVWSEEDIVLLRMVAEIFANALDRKRAEREIRQAYSQLNTLLEAIPDAVYFKDNRKRNLIVNKAFEDLVGKGKTEIIGKTDDALFPPKLAELCEESDNLVLEEREIVRSDEFMMKENEEEIYFETIKSPIFDEHGTIKGIVGISRDITERKRAEQELQKTRDELEVRVKERTEELAKANWNLEQEIEERKKVQLALQKAKEEADLASRAKSEFLANMSHELRTPLNVILGYAQIFETAQNLTPRQKEGVKSIKNSGKHLLTFINDILDLSKIEAGKMELSPEEFNFHEFLDLISEMMQIQAKQKKLVFIYEKDADLPKGIIGDPKRLREILINLLSNAIKFTDEGKVVFNIENRSESEEFTTVRFTIRDTGIGIAKNKIEEIFMPFQQAVNTNDGTGLGLAITSKLLRMMDSELNVDSQPGEGSHFWFDLQVTEIDKVIPQISTKPKSVIGYKGERLSILVVDDRKENRKLLVDMLSPLDFQMLEAQNGKECLQKCINFKPDVIFLDLKMPIMDGLEVLQRIRNRKELRNITVIIVSASQINIKRNDIQAMGADDFILKPIKLKRILKVLARNLGVEWIYEESEVDGQEVLDSDIETEEIILFSSEQIRTIADIAASGNARTLKEELDKMERENKLLAPLIDKIRSLVDAYEFDQIIEMLRFKE